MRPLRKYPSKGGGTSPLNLLENPLHPSTPSLSWEQATQIPLRLGLVWCGATPCHVVNPAQKQKAALQVPPSRPLVNVGVLVPAWRVPGKGMSAGCCGNRNSFGFFCIFWPFAFDVVFTSQFALNFVPPPVALSLRKKYPCSSTRQKQNWHESLGVPAEGWQRHPGEGWLCAATMGPEQSQV